MALRNQRKEKAQLQKISYLTPKMLLTIFYQGITDATVTDKRNNELTIKYKTSLRFQKVYFEKLLTWVYIHDMLKLI